MSEVRDLPPLAATVAIEPGIIDISDREESHAVIMVRAIVQSGDEQAFMVSHSDVELLVSLMRNAARKARRDLSMVQRDIKEARRG